MDIIRMDIIRVDKSMPTLIWTLVTCQSTHLMFTNNGAHVMAGGMQCTSVLFEFYYCDTLFLYAHVSILMIFKNVYILLM